jgi:hypothetical protein
MFKTCFSKCVARNPIYYEIPATYHINNHVNNINYNTGYNPNNNINNRHYCRILPPPIPPRRCRAIKNSLGELIPLSTDNICMFNNINSYKTNEIYSVIPDDLQSVKSVKSLTLPTKPKQSLTSTKRPNSVLSSSISLPDLKMFDDDWFNMQLSNDYFAKNNLKDEKSKDEIEPLFTVDINIKNERNGVVSSRKIFM